MSGPRRRQKQDLPAYRVAMDRAHVGEGPAPFCLDLPDIYVDFDLKDKPSPREAEKMCEPCPLLEVCRANARHRRPAHGVWGGILWIKGRRADLMLPGDPRLVDEI